VFVGPKNQTLSQVVVDSVSVDGNQITIALKNNILNNQDVAFTYVKTTNYITDAYGNDIDPADFTNVALFEEQDNTPPVVQSVTVDGATDALYGFGDPITLKVHFSENVYVTTTNGTPRIALNVNETTRYATYNGSGSGTKILSFTYTVQDGDEANAVEDYLGYNQVKSLQANGGKITDSLNTEAIYDLPQPGVNTPSAGSLRDNSQVSVDGIIPVLLPISEGSVYKASATAGTKTIVMTVSESLLHTDVFDTSSFVVKTGGTVNAVTAVQFSNNNKTITLTLTNVIVNSESITLTHNLNADDAKRLVDAAGNELASFTDQSIVKLTNDNKKPEIVSFTTDSPNDSYRQGDVISIAATVDEMIRAGDTIVVKLNTSPEKTVTLTAAADGLTLVGDYTVGASDSSGQSQLRITSYEYDPGDVKDLAGNAMINLLLPQINLDTDTAQVTREIYIDNSIFPVLAADPTITNVGSDNTLDAGDTITYAFLEAMSEIDGKTLENYFETTDLYGLDGSRAVATVAADNKSVSVVLGVGESLNTSVSGGTTETYTLPAVKDLAGNVIDITYDMPTI